MLRFPKIINQFLNYFDIALTKVQVDLFAYLKTVSIGLPWYLALSIKYSMARTFSVDVYEVVPAVQN